MSQGKSSHRVAAYETSFKQVSNALVAYQANHASLPPGYGYRVTSPNSEDECTALEPYTSSRYTDLIGVEDLYDGFSTTHDANGNGRIDLLEYCPTGAVGPDGRVAFPVVLYDPAQPANPAYADDVARQLAQERPFIYIPVNSEDALNVRRYYEDTSPHDADFLDRMFARVWDESPTNSFLARINSGKAPPYFDAFVLLSVGPTENTFGVIPSDIKAAANPNRYYINALRAFYLATRDADRNGELDFDFRSRSRRNEAEPRAYEKAAWGPIDPASRLARDLTALPDGSHGYGPLMFVSGDY